MEKASEQIFDASSQRHYSLRHVSVDQISAAPEKDKLCRALFAGNHSPPLVEVLETLLDRCALAKDVILKKSGIHIECEQRGWQITQLPSDLKEAAQFERVSPEYGLVDGVLEGAAACLYAIPQENDIDTTDRIDACARLLRDLVEAGL